MRPLLVIGLAGVLWGQQTVPQTFEVAVVKLNDRPVPSPAGTGDGPPPPPPPPVLQPTPGGLTIENATLQYCLVWAYGVRDSQVTCPDWIRRNHYDIHAKTPAPVEGAQLKLMLQELLKQRFRLSLRHESKQSNVLALVPGPRGSKLAPSKPGTPAGRETRQLEGGVVRFTVHNTTLDFLEQILSLPVWDPIVNQTGITGGVDFTFERPRMSAESADALLAKYEEALESQLGLRLQPRQAPLDTITIESGSPHPIEN